MIHMQSKAKELKEKLQILFYLNIFINVLFPDPFCPTTPICSPLYKSKVAFLYKVLSIKQCGTFSTLSKLIMIPLFLKIKKQRASVF